MRTEEKREKKRKKIKIQDAESKENDIHSRLKMEDQKNN